MRRQRGLRLIGGSGLALLVSVSLGGLATAATDPASLTSPSVTVNDSATSQTDVNGVGLVVSHAVDATTGNTKSSAPLGETTTNIASSAAVPGANGSGALSGTLVATPATIGSDLPATVLPNSSHPITFYPTSTFISGWLALPQATAPIISTITESGTLTNHGTSQTPLPPHATGLVAQFTDLITRLAVPLAGSTGADPVQLDLVGLLSSSYLSSVIVIILIALVSNDYLAYLRRTGHSHGARSDADGLNMATPLLVGYSMVGSVGFVGGPFLVRSNLIKKGGK